MAKLPQKRGLNSDGAKLLPIEIARNRAKVKMRTDSVPPHMGRKIRPATDRQSQGGERISA